MMIVLLILNAIFLAVNLQLKMWAWAAVSVIGVVASVMSLNEKQNRP